MLVDQYTDPSFKHLARVLRDNPHAAEFIKTACIDTDEVGTLPDSAFAARGQRMFRIDTPAHAALSRVYVEKQAGVPHEVVQRITAALETYNINMPLTQKVASIPDSDYIFPETKQYLIQDATDVKLAAEGLLRNSGALEPLRRAAACQRLLKHAVNYDVKLPDGILKMAGVTCADRDTLQHWLEIRSSAAQKAGKDVIADAYTKLASLLDAESAVLWDNMDLGKLTDAMFEMDKQAGLDTHYGKLFPDPILTIYNMSKISEGTVSVAGTPVPLDTLAAIPREDYAAIVGDDVANEFFSADGAFDPVEFETIWNTIPYDLQKVLRSQLGM